MTTQLGSKYQLDEVLGRGASGEVWSGTGPDGPVAIKVLRRELAQDPLVLERFVGERSLLLGIDSPHVVGVRDLVIEGDRLAIVMDLVAGGDLRTLLRSERTLVPAVAVEIIAQVLDGLTTVHEAGVVHRDLKPENILIEDRPDGMHVQVADFGIARLASGSRLTRTTGLLGTPRYVAPEVVERGKAAPPADVYAAGVTLFELLFGRVPFDGPHPAAVLRAHAEGCATRPNDVPDSLWLVLAGMLAKNASDRPSAGAAATRLRALGSDVSALPRFPRLAPMRDDGELTATTDPHGNATDLTGTGRRGWLATDRAATAPANASGRRRSLALVLGALTIVGVLVAGVTVLSHDAPRRFLLAGATVPFDDDTQGKLTIERTWGFGKKDGSELVSELAIRAKDRGPLPAKASFLEVLPPEVTTKEADVDFGGTTVAVNAASLAGSGGAGKAIKATSTGLKARIPVAAGKSVVRVSYRVQIPRGSTSQRRLDNLAWYRNRFWRGYCKTTGSNCDAVQLDQISFLAFPAAVGISQVFNANAWLEGVNSDGSRVPAGTVDSVKWSIDPAGAAFAKVDRNGLVTGVFPGVATVTAETPGVPPTSLTISVTQQQALVASSIRVLGDETVILGNALALPGSRRYTVEGKAQDGSVIPVVGVIWSVDPSWVGSIGSDGDLEPHWFGDNQVARAKVRAEYVNAEGKKLTDALDITVTTISDVVTFDPRTSPPTSTGPGPGTIPTIPTTGTTATTASTTPFGKPDLVITAFSPPSTLAAGTCFRFEVTIKNIGTGPTPGATKHGVLFVVDGQHLWTSLSQTAMQPGESRPLSADGGRGDATCNPGADMFRPLWLATSGSHSVLAWVDDTSGGHPTGFIDESNEDNNKWPTQTITVP